MIPDSYVLDVSQRWSFRLELLFELLDSLPRTFYLDFDIFRSVVHPTPKIVFDSQPVDERPETDALDDAPDANRS